MGQHCCTYTAGLLIDLLCMMMYLQAQGMLVDQQHVLRTNTACLQARQDCHLPDLTCARPEMIAMTLPSLKMQQDHGTEHTFLFRNCLVDHCIACNEFVMFVISGLRTTCCPHVQHRLPASLASHLQLCKDRYESSILCDGSSSVGSTDSDDEILDDRWAKFPADKLQDIMQHEIQVMQA